MELNPHQYPDGLLQRWFTTLPEAEHVLAAIPPHARGPFTFTAPLRTSPNIWRVDENLAADIDC